MNKNIKHLFEQEDILEKKYIISIDMGGTKILASAINSKEGVIARLKRPTKLESNQNKYVKILSDITKDLVKEAKLSESSIKAVSLGIPGSVNPITGKVGLAPNLGLKNLMLKEKLQKLIPYPVLIENDVNLGALGIKYFGVGKESKNMLAVFVGTGIGGALILENKIYRGTNFVAGEIGHMKVQKGGPLCGCGNHGCFEAIASRTAIEKQIRADIRAKKKSVLTKIAKSKQKIKSKAIANALKEGDKVVIKRITEACETIGMVLANLTNVMDFDTIVLGGGLVEAIGKFMLPLIKKSFKDSVLKDAAKGIKIIDSKLGDDAALYGGIALAEEFLGIKV